MKIRHPWLIKLFGFVVAWIVRLWISTLRYRYRPLGPNFDPNQPGFGGRYIYVFWHENILIPAYHYGRTDIWVLISQHADGRLIAEACRHLRFKVVAGSTTRGGVDALRQMMRRARRGHLAITPDGPRGPRQHVQPGVVYLAARTGLPIVPMGVAFAGAWRLRSWDRFVLPHPGSAVTLVTGDLIHVPEGADKEQLEAYRLRVEEAMNRVTEAAEQFLAGKRIASPAAHLGEITRAA